jgi:Flp pilus assembly protein CpaB
MNRRRLLFIGIAALAAGSLVSLKVYRMLRAQSGPAQVFADVVVAAHDIPVGAKIEDRERCASDSMDKLAASLADAQVDLNPHQVEAALFAFRSPLSKGAILADEVGAQRQRGSTGIFPRNCN